MHLCPPANTHLIMHRCGVQGGHTGPPLQVISLSMSNVKCRCHCRGRPMCLPTNMHICPPANTHLCLPTNMHICPPANTHLIMHRCGFQGGHTGPPLQVISLSMSNVKCRCHCRGRPMCLPTNTHLCLPRNMHICPPANMHICPPANTHLCPPANTHLIMHHCGFQGGHTGPPLQVIVVNYE